MSSSPDPPPNGTDRDSIKITMQEKTESDDGINPLKRGADTALDYPRRRATIAVGESMSSPVPADTLLSVKSVGLASQDVMVRNRSVNCAQN